MKDERLYAKFTLDFPDHPKILCLSTAAKWALVDLTIYSRRHMTDGFISKSVALAKHGATACQELAENDPAHPSLVEVEGGYQIHDFALHQSTKAEIEALTAKRRAAGQKGGQSKALASAKQKPKQTGSKTYPETETELNNSRRNSASSDMDRIDVRRILEALTAHLSTREVKTPKSLDSWATDARRLLDIDKRPLEEVLRVLEFSQTDSFWQSNILSMRKFRAQYDQLRLRMGDWKPAAKPEDRIRDAWRNGFDAELSRMATEPFLVEWPDPMPDDRDAERLRQWREWLKANKDDLERALERAS